MTTEEIEKLYTLSNGEINLDKKNLISNIGISSRLKYIEDTKAKEIARFLLDYCFKDSEEIYTNGTILVPMFRVLDALSMIQSTKIQYCDVG